MTQSEIPAKAAKSKGRPKAARIRDHWISFRVTAEEHFQLIDKAQRSSMLAMDGLRMIRGTTRLKPSSVDASAMVGATI